MQDSCNSHDRVKGIFLHEILRHETVSTGQKFLLFISIQTRKFSLDIVGRINKFIRKTTIKENHWHVGS